MSEPDDWDVKIEALDALHESLKSRLIEAQPSLPVETPPVPCPPGPEEPEIESEGPPSPSAPDLPEAFQLLARVESRPPLPQEPVAPEIHDVGRTASPLASEAGSWETRATGWSLGVFLACAMLVLTLAMLSFSGRGRGNDDGRPATPRPGGSAPQPVDLSAATPEDESREVGPTPASESVERPAGTAAPSVVTIPAEWNGNWASHIAYHEEEIRRHPTRASEYVALGIYCCKNGNTGEAIANFTKALRIDSSCSRAYHNRGVAWIVRGDVDRAIADFNNAVRLDPAYAAAYRNRGLAYRLKGELRLAEADRALAESLER